jgi:hypothetical protein
MPETEATNHVWTDEERECWHCAEPTKWLELAFEAPLHPGPCTDAKYEELAEADRQAAERLAADQAEQPARGTRKTENGQTMEWTGAFWKVVTRAELEREARRR